MQRGIHALIIAAFAATVASATFAAPDPPAPPPEPEKDKKLEQARAAIAAEDWGRARDVLRQALQDDPGKAEYHNLYAYSIRKGDRPAMDLVFRHYNEALRLRPTHLGAHEYLGEAYLMVGNLAKAREHLGVLERLCGACDEQAKLARAVSTAERQSAAK
jgi:Flp pilus assembly protein TadD